MKEEEKKNKNYANHVGFMCLVKNVCESREQELCMIKGEERQLAEGDFPLNL